MPFDFPLGAEAEKFPTFVLIEIKIVFSFRESRIFFAETPLITTMIDKGKIDLYRF